jgi:glycosyltransferase involved in cell wall biosynthesis
MRILHLIHSEGIYGAESILLYLAREQQRRGHEPMIGSIRDTGTPETPFEALSHRQGLTVIPIRIAPWPTPAVVRSLLRTVQAFTPDVLHSHGYKANILLAPVPRRRRGAMLATLHGWTSTRRLSRKWVYERLDRWALRRVDAVAVVSHYMLGLRALQGAAVSRLHVIENGIPPLATRLDDLTARGVAPLPPELIEFAKRRPTLLAIGRLSPEKGFMALLEAFACARAETASACQLLLVGEGSQRDLLANRISSLGLSGTICLGGYVEGADRLLEPAAGFVMCSLTEGMPLVLLEAMQWRVPILATAVGGVPEVLDEGRRGRLVAPNDLTALTAGLRTMMSADSAPEPLIAAAHTAVSELYTNARMTDAYLSAYASIA